MAAYPYLQGKIVLQGGKKIPISRAQMSDIAGAYRQWWERNKTKSLQELRDAWASGDRPLTGSRFAWI